MTTYAELTTQILNYTETSTDVLSSTITDDFIEHTENRILSLWEICTKIPMTIDLRSNLLNSNDIGYRYNLLENYLNEINERMI